MSDKEFLLVLNLSLRIVETDCYYYELYHALKKDTLPLYPPRFLNKVWLDTCQSVRNI